MLNPLALARRAQGEEPLTPALTMELRSACSMALHQSFVVEIGQSLEPGERYDFIGVVDRPGKTPPLRPLFRVWTNEGLNYHELIVEPDLGGNLRLADVWSLSTGETASRWTAVSLSR